MAKYSSSINYKITTSLDASGITKLQAELNKLEHEFTDLNKRDLMTNAQTQAALNDIQRIEKALRKAFNPSLGMVNTKTLMNELTAGGRSLSQIYSNLGPRGTSAMAQLYGQIGKIDTGMKSVSKTTDKVFNTLGNTVRWGVIASGFQYVLNSAHNAVQYMRDLDESLTNIRLVTDESKESMREFALYANKAAQNLGNTTVAYTDAALIYAQQGYGLDDQKILADYTLKAANATGQDTTEVSAQMTSMINGFQLSVDEVGGALDVLAKVANTSAADMEELATATAKVASTANTLGVTQEQLTAQIATIVSVTKEAPENVGNALKTIYARFGDLSLGETLEDGTNLGKVSGTLEKIGVQVLDDTGAMRDMGAIMEDLMAVWETLDQADKQATAVTIAGKYQYNRLMALMENSDMYEGYLGDAESSEGTLDTMQSEYMESLKGKTNALIASLQGALSSLFNQDTLGPFIDDLTEIVNKFTEMTEAIGGGGAALTAFGAIATKTFSNNIGRSISNIIGNKQKANIAQANVNNAADMAKAGALSQGVSSDNSLLKNMGKDMESVNLYARSMNQEQIEQVNQKHQEYAEAVMKADAAQKKFDSTINGAKIALNELGIGTKEYRGNVISMLQTLEAGDTKLDDLKNNLSIVKDQFTNAQQGIVRFANSVEGIDATSASADWDKIQRSAGNLSVELGEVITKLKNAGASTKDVKKLQVTLEELSKTTQGDQKDFERFQQILKECTGAIDKFRTSAEFASQAEEVLAQDAIEARNALSSQTAVVNGIRDSYDGLEKSFQQQSMASHITDLTSGVMSLAFAFQSLQSLGSILANDDLTSSEKMFQIFTNGLMTITMLSMGYMEISRSVAQLKAVTQGATLTDAAAIMVKRALFGETKMVEKATADLVVAQKAQDKAISVTKAKEAALINLRKSGKITGKALAIAEKELADARLKQAAATKIAAEAEEELQRKQKEYDEGDGGLLKKIKKLVEKFKGLSGGLKAASGAFLGIGAAISIALIAYGAYRKQLEEQLAFHKEQLDASNELLDSIKEEKDALDSMYEEYKKTGDASEDFKDTLRSLGEQLGVTNTELYLQAGNYDTLKKKIDEATIAQLEFNAASADVVARDVFKTGDGFFGLEYSSEDDYVQAGLENREAQERTKEQLQDNAKRRQQIATSTDEKYSGSNGEGLRQADLRAVEQDRVWLENQLSGLQQTATDEQFDVYASNKKAALDSQFEADMASEDFSEMQGQNLDAITGYLESIYGDYLKVFTEEERQAKVLEMASLLADGWEDTALQAEAAQRAAEDTFNAYVKEAGTEVTAQEILDQINVDLEDSEKIDLFNALQSSELTGKEFTDYLNEIIARINNGEELDDILVDIKNKPIDPASLTESDYDNMVDTSDSELQSRINATGMSTEGYENYRDGAYSDLVADTFGAEQNNIITEATQKQTEATENLAAAKEEVAALEQAGKKFTPQWVKAMGKKEEAEKDLTEAEEKLAEVEENRQQQLDDMASKSAKVATGIQDLADNIDDYQDKLSNNAQGTEEWNEAYEGITGALSNITGFDASTFDAQFIVDNLDLIKEASSGSEQALADLQAKAAEKYLINLNLNLDDSDQAEVYNQCSDLIEWANTNLPDIVAGASIDDTYFTNTLNTMVANAIAAGLDVDQILAGIAGTGIDFEIEEYKTVYVYDENGNVQSHLSYKVPVLKARKTGDIPTRAGGYSGAGKGGSGGGGGGSKYEPKTEEHLEEDPDRYQNVNAHLDRLSNNLEKVADEQDRLVGKDMLENMAEQVELIKQQVEWHQKKLNIQKEEAAELRNELGKDYGIVFDSEGYMTNYQEIHQKLVDEYNALVDQYNATSDEEGQTKIKEKMDAVKEKIDSFNEAWERYDELMNNEIPESINTLEDLEDQIEDLRIEAFNAYVEAAENIKDIQDAWADYVGFMSELKPDSPFRSLIEDAEKYENSIDLVAAKQENLEELMKWSSQYQPGGIITSDNPFGENSAEYYNALREAYDAYIEAVIDAESLYYDQIDDIIEAYDEIADKIEKRMENYAQLGEQLDHYASVIETLYGEEDYDNLLALKRANQDILESSVEQARKNLSMWQGELSKYNRETQPEIWEAIHEKVVEAQSELNGLVEEAAQNTAEILEMAVDKTVKEWKDTMLGGDATWAETQWEMAKELADQYLDTVEETYEIEKLRSKYNNLANDTMDLNLRKRINEQMEKELKYLQEKDKLSEYDVKYANAKLEILQKQIALEEAQANKNQMKLRRDSQGNYSYVYAADKDDVAQAESDLLDAEFNAYDMSKENYMTNYDNYVSAINSAAERIKAINMDMTLSEEEKAKRVQEIYDWLNTYLSGIAEQIGVSQQGMIESVAWLAMDTSGIAGETFANISAMMQEDWTEALGAIGVATSESFEYVISNIDEFLEKTKEKWTEFEEHTSEWAKNVQDIADDGTEGFRQVDNIILTIKDDMKDLNEETETFFGLINDDLGTIDKAVGKLADYEAQILGLKDSSSKIARTLEETRQKLVDKEKEVEDLQGEINRLKNGDGENSSGSGGSSGRGGSDENKVASIASEALEIVKGVHYGTIANGSEGWRPSARKAGYSEDAISIALKAFNDSKTGSGYNYYYNRALELVKSYDTGGYTGVWGKEGRLAMLHQKELVLNAQDTENILSAVNVIREIVAAIKSDSLSSFASVFKNNNIATNTGNNVEQNISIYADFPAAESAAEIKAALEGLTQQAVQYAKRTR